MATRTSITNGSWSATGTWGAAAPADGDSVVIATGTTVTFDADQTAFLTGVGLTVNAGGVLTASTASGSYCLRIGVDNPTINGTLTIGTSATPYPFDCKFTIRMTGGGSSSRYFTGAGYKYFCGTEPTTLLVKLKETATIGATAFTVVNLTGGTVNLSADAVPWVIGNTIGICDSATPRNDTETLTISSFSTSGSDCVIQTTAGLASQKDVNSIVYLQTRNVRVTDGTSYFLFSNNNYVCCEVSGQSMVGYNQNNLNVIGGCYHHQSNYTFTSCYNSTFSNAVIGQTAYPYALLQCTNIRVNNCYFIGTGTLLCFGNNITGVIDNSYFFGHGNTMQYNSDFLKYNNCIFDYNTVALYYFGSPAYNCSFLNMSNSIINTPNNSFSMYNCSFGSGSVEMAGIAANQYIINTAYIDSFDHNQVSGAYKSWTKGAITTYPNTIGQPAYENYGGSGNRTSTIVVSTSTSLFVGTASTLVNGVLSENVLYFSDTTAPDAWVQFDFGFARLVTEAKWYQSSTSSHGTWKWQGSNDGNSWDDIGSSFTLGGASTQTITELSGNTTSYRYYRLYGVSGTMSQGPYLYEVEFKINDINSPAGQTSAYKVTFSSASYYGYYQLKDTVLPNETLTYRVYVKKSAAMTYLPRIQIIDASQDPLERSSSFTPLAEQLMTDSILTWEYYDVTYTNTTAFSKNIYLRVLGENASGDVYVVPVKLDLKESWG